MSQQKPKTITLRRLEPGEVAERSVQRVQDGAWVLDGLYREVSPIPEGFEVCDLADATKVLIGETWCEIERDAGGSWIMVPPNKTYHTHGFSKLGLLAIRPIPEPEPMRGEGTVVEGVIQAYLGGLPFGLIGKTIRWEVVKDGGE